MPDPLYMFDVPPQKFSENEMLRQFLYDFQDWEKKKGKKEEAPGYGGDFSKYTRLKENELMLKTFLSKIMGDKYGPVYGELPPQPTPVPTPMSDLDRIEERKRIEEGMGVGRGIDNW